MKKHTIPLLASLCLICALLIPGTFAGPDTGSGDSGMVINKTATDNGDGSYTIELEAYATGSKIITSVSKAVPTDVVLVLDQSGSMANCIVCGNEILAGSSHNTYTAESSVKSSGTYYIKNGSRYTRVYYCDGEHSAWWGSTNCQGGAGFYPSTQSTQHTEENRITPKTPETPDGIQFYTISGQERCTSRLSALKTAVTTFANSVAAKASGEDGTLGTADDVNHRVAVVGFSSGSFFNGQNYNYANTEVFIGSSQHRYGTAAQRVYNSAFQSMNTTQGQANITASIGALDADGGTLAHLGLEMASGILDANPVGEGEVRNRVIVVFTDGMPGWSGYDSSVASAAISQANTAKEHGVTVYTVGIFDGADATSPGNSDGNDNQKANWFMQNLSSNNGTPQAPSYYLSAADAGTLNNIFKLISDQIETGGSGTTLNEKTVIKDIIAPAFSLPDGVTADDITLETYACTGKNGNGYTWAKNSDAMGAAVTITSTDTTNAATTNNQLSITGFDFAENFVGTVSENGTVTYRGHKLVIRFTVIPRPGFLGGNGVATNTVAGVYENSSADVPILTFPQPTVDVPLAMPDVEITGPDRYLGTYFSQTVPEDLIKMGTAIRIGDCTIDPSKSDDPAMPYGLEPWQTEYVNISVSSAVEGNGGSFENTQEDIRYTVTVSVTPKKPGTYTGQDATDTAAGEIYVFKPLLTFRDSEVWYGGDAPAAFGSSLTEETWVNSDGTKKHDDSGVHMVNEKPILALEYAPENGKIVDGKISSKQDIGVHATVRIGGTDISHHTAFHHSACSSDCSWPGGSEGNPAFCLHVRTCSLTVRKTGGKSGDTYVFIVRRNGGEYSQILITGNGEETLYELPVGNYTVAEDAGWSWRYTPNYSPISVVLSSRTPSGVLTCTNEKVNPYWLNGFSSAAHNVSGDTD